MEVISIMANNQPLVSISIDGGTTYTDLPTPIEYKMTSSTLVDSARNTKGVVIASVIREGVRKVQLKWNYLTITEFSNIAKLFESGTRTLADDTTETISGSFFFKAKFFDSVLGKFIKDVDMYVGDRITDTAKITLIDGKPVGYTNVSLSLIEV